MLLETEDTRVITTINEVLKKERKLILCYFKKEY